MMHRKNKIAVFALLLFGMLFIWSGNGQAVCNLIGSMSKPDSVTQTRCTELRSSPTDRSAPGFDPSKLLTHSFPGEVGGTQAIDSALELFVVLGPGEVTGNPFGEFLDKTNITCSEVGGPIGHECQGLNNINLGRAKFNTATQNDVPPSFGPCLDISGGTPGTPITATSTPSSLKNPPPNAQMDCPNSDTSGFLTVTFTTQGDFFPFDITHVGFDSIIAWEAIPGQTYSPNQTFCSAPIGWTCVNSSQTIKQITGVFNDLGTGSITAPGAGDQIVVNNMAAWSVQSKGDLKYTSPTMVWTQQVTDPDFSGVAIAGFDERVSGSFLYCQGSHAPGGPCEANDVPLASYTTGDSQRNGAFSSLGGD